MTNVPFKNRFLKVCLKEQNRTHVNDIFNELIISIELNDMFNELICDLMFPTCTIK